MSLCVGIGVTVLPYACQDMRASPYTAGKSALVVFCHMNSCVQYDVSVI